MAKDANVFARVDSSVKEEAEGVLARLGLPMSNAINLFLNQIILRQGLPFEVSLTAPRPVAMGSLTQEQLYTELKKGHDDCVAGRTIPADDAFRGLEAELGV